MLLGYCSTVDHTERKKMVVACKDRHELETSTSECIKHASLFLRQTDSMVWYSKGLNVPLNTRVHTSFKRKLDLAYNFCLVTYVR